MTFFYRIYQFILKMFVALYPFPKPELYVGEQGFKDFMFALSHAKHKKILIVTDQVLKQLLVINQITDALDNMALEYVVFADVSPNPTIHNVEQGLVFYQSHQCDAIMAIGGGSVIDCAKLIGARAVKPNKTLKQLKGLFKILKKLPPLYAIPTTAGTGSETTVAAVVSDTTSHQKYAVTDLVLMPKAALLYPPLTVNLPSSLTATTAMDALTHAIEAFIGINGLAFSDQKALLSAKLILTYLPKCLAEPTNLDYREQLQLASFYAGEAFTRTSVGYVHAIAHNLGAKYGIAHGLANAIALPHVLTWYGESIESKMATLYDYCQLELGAACQKTKAKALISFIEQLNQSMDIPIEYAQLKSSDFTALAHAILQEAHPDYPVPRFMNNKECEQLLRQLSV